jgi:enoyl-[acyl-carrier protein] reductase I
MSESISVSKSLSPSPFNLAGKKGLVLGIANDHSIAWECAKIAHEQGAELIATCLNDKARTYVQPLTDSITIPLLNCNVEEPEALAKVVEDAAKQLGQLDFVIHSIAWAPLDDLHAHVIDTSSEGFSKAMEISCHSFATLAKVCVNHMPEGGSLITMTYLGAQRAIPHYGLMGPVKAALESLVRYMAIELGPQAIRVHAVSPGPIMTRAASGIEAFDELLDHSKSVAPLKRLVKLEEIANLAVFLSSDASSGMTGQTIYVDAGCHAVA